MPSGVIATEARIHREVEHPDASLDWFETLVRQVEVPAYQLAVMLCHDIDLAKEVVQEAIVRAWQSPKTPQETEDFRRWLYKIMVNLIRDQYRRERRLSKGDVVTTESPDPVDEVVRRQRQLALAKAFRTLSRRERLVIYLRFFDQASHKEVAQMLGAPEIVARVLLHRTLRKLKRHLEKEGVTEVGVTA